MITQLFLYGVYVVLLAITAPLRLLADAALPAGISTAVVSASSYMAALNVFIPCAAIIETVGAIMLIETAILTWGVINWVIRKIPGLK